MGVKFYN